VTLVVVSVIVNTGAGARVKDVGSGEGAGQVVVRSRRQTGQSPHYGIVSITLRFSLQWREQLTA
jgi:hypothetical protein